MPTEKYAFLAQNLALHRVGRVGRQVSDMESFSFSYWLGVAIVTQYHPCSPEILNGFKRLLNSVCTTKDFLGFVEACSALRLEIVQAGRIDWDLTNHKPRRWTKGIIQCLKHVYSSSVCHPSIAFDAIATFLGWFKRLPICIRPVQDSVEAYLACDARVSELDFDPGLVNEIRLIWVEWFSNFHLSEPFLPRHGSGATADAGRIRSQKWDSLRTDQAVRVCLKYPTLERIEYDVPQGGIRKARVVFVPKQAGKDRTICMEPASLQYLQQGISRQLVDFASSGKHPLSRLVVLKDQSVNRRLCARAFSEGLATIDLSDASDSVSWKLIKELTAGMPLMRYLFGSRSTHNDIYGYEFQVAKFAPMGSNLCFPIESYLFASIVECAYRKHYGRASTGHHSGCSVYGDDIICPSEIYHSVVDILSQLGFIVNQSKSFSQGFYYESCGVEYCYGYRINTVRHPRNHLLLEEMSPSKVELVTDLANTLLAAGYIDARRLLLQIYCKSTIRIGKQRLVFGDLMRFDESHCIPLESPQMEVVYHDNYQQYMRRHLVCRSVPKPGRFDYIEYLSRYPRRPRWVRISDHYHNVDSNPNPVWSVEAVLALSRFKYFDLLKEGELIERGVCRTGPMQTTLCEVFIPH